MACFGSPAEWNFLHLDFGHESDDDRLAHAFSRSSTKGGEIVALWATQRRVGVLGEFEGVEKVFALQRGLLIKIVQNNFCKII